MLFCLILLLNYFFSQSVEFFRPRILDWFGSHLPNDPKEKLQASNCNGKFCWNCQNCKLRHIQTNRKCKHFILLKCCNCYAIVHKLIVLLQHLIHKAWRISTKRTIFKINRKNGLSCNLQIQVHKPNLFEVKR